jgi:SAM-dependent methyltransferase
MKPGFYAAVGPSGLADIAPPWTVDDRRWLRPQLTGRRNILDAGCGYGRIAQPLSEAGHDVLGIDLDPGLITDARRRARGLKLPLRYRVGDIRALPAAEASQDAVLCLWSTFQHLLTRADQRRFLGEARRVLRPGGRLILEMTDAGEPKLAARLAREGTGRQRRIASWTLHGSRIRCFLHDAASLDAVLSGVGFASHHVTTRTAGTISRLTAVADVAEQP